MATRRLAFLPETGSWHLEERQIIEDRGGGSRQRGGYAFEVSLSASDEGVMAARIRAILEMLDAQFCPGEAS